MILSALTVNPNSLLQTTVVGNSMNPITNVRFTSNYIQIQEQWTDRLLRSATSTIDLNDPRVVECLIKLGWIPPKDKKR